MKDYYPDITGINSKENNTRNAVGSNSKGKAPSPNYFNHNDRYKTGDFG
jgi:hypothetical protein